jgi:hypothetical protein
MQRMWFAAAVPLAAILFAFSLGPSPRKTLNALEARSLTPEAAYQAFVAGPPGINAILVERIHHEEWAYRLPAVQALGVHRYQPARRALERLVADEAAAPELRSAGREALSALGGAWWVGPTASNR